MASCDEVVSMETVNDCVTINISEVPALRKTSENHELLKKNRESFNNVTEKIQALPHRQTVDIEFDSLGYTVITNRRKKGYKTAYSC